MLQFYLTKQKIYWISIFLILFRFQPVLMVQFHELNKTWSQLWYCLPAWQWLLFLQTCHLIFYDFLGAWTEATWPFGVLLFCWPCAVPYLPFGLAFAVRGIYSCCIIYVCFWHQRFLSDMHLVIFSRIRWRYVSDGLGGCGVSCFCFGLSARFSFYPFFIRKFFIGLFYYYQLALINVI